MVSDNKIDKIHEILSTMKANHTVVGETEIDDIFEDNEKQQLITLGFFTSKGPLYQELAQHFVDKYRIYSHEGYTYIFDKSHYIPCGPMRLNNLIHKETKFQCSPHHLTGFSKIIGTYAFNREVELMDTKGKINLANGILEIKNKTLIPHSSNYDFKYCLKYPYIEDAQCPQFMKFLTSVFEDDQEQIDAVQEIMGYCMLGGNPFLHQAFVLYGTGRNGKSVLIDIMKEMLGAENVGSVSLALLDKPFSAVRLDGKLANLVEETPNDTINAEAFKSAVAGGSLSAAHKGKPEFDLPIQCRFVFAANKLPRFSEKSVGLFERLYFLRFDKFIQETERDRWLGQRIMETEMPGIINFALNGAQRVLESGIIKKTKAHKRTFKEFMMEGDSVYEWVMERVKFDDGCTYKYYMHELYAEYKKYTEKYMRKPVSLSEFQKRFTPALRDVVTVHEMTLVCQRNKTARYYTMLGVKSDSSLMC